MTAAMEAMLAGMNICPDEFKGDTVLKTVWLAGFMRGYRFKQEEPSEHEYRFAEVYDDGVIYTHGPKGDPGGSFQTADEASKSRIEDSDVIVRRRKATEWEVM